MTSIKIIILFILGITIFNQANAQNMESTTEHKKLSVLVGRWTIQGMEDKFIEVCEMYPGGHFLVCNSESKTKSGGLNKGVSIIGNPAGSDHLTYYHYGSTGASQTLKGRIDDEGSLCFEGEEIINGKLTKTRVNMKKNGETYDFKEETSIDGGDWTTSAAFVYIRAK